MIEPVRLRRGAIEPRVGLAALTAVLLGLAWLSGRGGDQPAASVAAVTHPDVVVSERDEEVTAPEPVAATPDGPECPALASVENTWTVAPHPAPAEALAVSPADADIVDYYHHFFSVPLETFESLDYQAAHARGTYQLSHLDREGGYMAFGTRHTPPDWDGDSKTEQRFELRVWSLPEVGRVVALNKSENTWVSDFSRVVFYRHDAEGLHPFQPSFIDWDIHTFVDRPIAQWLPDDVVNDPPVSISLRADALQDERMMVRLAIDNEYAVPESLWETYLCLGAPGALVFIDPITGRVARMASGESSR